MKPPMMRPSKPMPIDSTISALLKRPALEQAMSEGGDQRGEPVVAPSEWRRQSPQRPECWMPAGNMIMNPGQSGTLFGKALHELKNGPLISAKDFNPVGGANKAQSGAIGDAAKDYAAWLGNAIPEPRHGPRYVCGGKCQSQSIKWTAGKLSPKSRYRRSIVTCLPAAIERSGICAGIDRPNDDIARNVTGMPRTDIGQGAVTPDNFATLKTSPSDPQKSRLPKTQ